MVNIELQDWVVVIKKESASFGKVGKVIAITSMPGSPLRYKIELMSNLTTYMNKGEVILLDDIREIMSGLIGDNVYNRYMWVRLEAIASIIKISKSFSNIESLRECLAKYISANMKNTGSDDNVHLVDLMDDESEEDVISNNLRAVYGLS